jgi:transcriptional regulator with PAS, ATPase and Fis domain
MKYVIKQKISHDNLLFVNQIDIYLQTLKINPMKTLREQMNDAEKDIIQKALLEHKYNKTKTAKNLNIGREFLYRKIKKYKIEI